MKKETDVHKELGIFSNFLKTHGLKITNQRLLVAEKVFRETSHFTVDSLGESLKDRKDEISRASIYRIVSLLVESGQVVEHNFGQSVKYYEHIVSRHHHDHIVCLDCGYIEEFFVPNIEQTQEEIAEENNFTLEGHSLILYGRCKLRGDGKECPRRTEKEIHLDNDDDSST